MLKYLIVILLVIGMPAVSHAQWARDAKGFAVEAAAGAGEDLVMRGPWIAPSWRHSVIGRVGLSFAVSAFYEKFVDVNGWSWQDVEQRAVGTIFGELIFNKIKI